MSQAPSTFGTMITSSLSPISLTSRHEVVEHPRAVEAVHAGPELAGAEVGVAAIFTSPSRARSCCRRRRRLRGCRAARRSFWAMSGTFAAILGLLGSKKWIIREGRKGISRRGWGHRGPGAGRKSLALRMGCLLLVELDDFASLPFGAASRHRSQSTHSSRFSSTIRRLPSSFWAKIETGQTSVSFLASSRRSDATAASTFTSMKIPGMSGFSPPFASG